jgi:hypothetical protein
MVRARMRVGTSERWALLAACLLPLLVTACGVQQVYTEPGPPIWSSPTGALSPESVPTRPGTRVVRVVTVVSEPTGTEAAPTSTPGVAADMGTLQGTLCYPSEYVPAMRVYLENVDTGEIAALTSELDQATFAVDLAPGSYVAYAHPVDHSFGGGAYSYAVPCGLRVECTDHRLLPFTIRAEETNKEVQICDWYAPKAVPPAPDSEQVRQVTPRASPTPTAVVVTTLPSGALVMEAKVGYVRVLPQTEAAPIYAGPGEDYGQVGQISGGRSVAVTGVSTDGLWWRVACPEEATGGCWISASPALTRPTAPYGP